MFVVRVENDEATMYRAFRHAQSARAWAAERNREDVHCLADIFETADIDDPKAAIATMRAGKAREFARAEAIVLPAPVAIAATDIRFGRAATL